MRNDKFIRARGVSWPVSGTLDIREAAALTKCHPSTLRKMAEAREVPSTKIGRTWVFSRTQLMDWIDARCRAAVVELHPKQADIGRSTLIAHLHRVLSEPSTLAERLTAERAGRLAQRRTKT